MRRLLWTLTACVAPLTALTLVAMSARPACACSTKAPGYRAQMKSDLRNLVSAQESFREDRRRYAGSIADLGTRYASSTGIVVTIDSLIGTQGWAATARHADLGEEYCQLSNVSTDDPVSQPRCSGDKRRAANQLALDVEFYIGLVAVIIAFATAAAGRMHWGAAMATVSTWVINPFAPGPLVQRCGDPSATVEGLLFTAATVVGCAAGLALRRARPRH